MMPHPPAGGTGLYAGSVQSLSGREDGVD